MAQIHVIGGAGESFELPSIRTITLSDLREALAKGWDDFSAMPSHAIFLCLIYPLVGIFLIGLAFGYSVLPLLFPLAAGFALIGPVAAVGLYELSRRREAGLDSHWTHAFDVLRSSSLPAIVALGLILMGIFLAWLGSAQALYQSLFGYLPPTSYTQFIRDVLTTPAGWSLIFWGNLIGFGFAVWALVISVVSFPMLVDRDVGAAAAITTSARAVMANPVTMAAWGFIVAALLLIGSLPAFIGLAVVMPVLGHATWHLYRKVVEGDSSPRVDLRPPQEGRHHVADFPVSLFTRR
ncbi:MAG: hypothetical protein QOF09_358 [Alphaproteobacteria bacterium]|jgi:uncharacterized membrane protein|nr:hypothetical protein [Alphaproteobacteria bacterium]